MENDFFLFRLKRNLLKNLEQAEWNVQNSRKWGLFNLQWFDTLGEV